MKKTYYDCKFERENKANPTDWIIVSEGYGGARLVKLGTRSDTVKEPFLADRAELRALDYGMMP